MALFPSLQSIKKVTWPCFSVTIYQQKRLIYEPKIYGSGVKLQDGKVLGTHPVLTKSGLLDFNDHLSTHSYIVMKCSIYLNNKFKINSRSELYESTLFKTKGNFEKGIQHLFLFIRT